MKSNMATSKAFKIHSSTQKIVQFTNTKPAK